MCNGQGEEGREGGGGARGSEDGNEVYSDIADFGALMRRNIKKAALT